MTIHDRNDIELGRGYYDDNNIWKKYCFVYCGEDRCDCVLSKILVKNETKLDAFTFGNSKAAITLVDILNETDNEKITQKVSGFIVRYHQLIKHAQDIKDPTTRSIVGYMFIEKINNSTLEVPDKVKSFMKNVVIGKIKDKLINL